MKWPSSFRSRPSPADRRTEAAIRASVQLRQRLATAVEHLEEFVGDVRDELERRTGDEGGHR